MCSLARVYVAVCRSRGSLSRARTFLYDCLYFLAPRSYALTYVIVSVWAEVLRQITFPLGTVILHPFHHARVMHFHDLFLILNFTFTFRVKLRRPIDRLLAFVLLQSESRPRIGW